MKDNDGFYLNDVWVATGDDIASTYQSNDLTKPTTLQSSYTNTFHIPDSLAVRKLTGNAEQLDSGSRDPYKALKAKVINGGEVIFTGFAEFDHFSSGWDITLFQEKKNLFDRLDRSLRTADLSRYDHKWSLEVINSLTGVTHGICYPLIDYGLLSAGGELPNDTLFPAIFVHTLLAQLFSEELYTLVGNLKDDELFKRLIIPFVDTDPTNHDQQWQDDRKARITWNAPTDEIDKGTLGGGHFIDRIQPFNLDNLVDQGFDQGKLYLYNTTTFTYVCDTAMRVRVQAFQQFKALCLMGGVEVVLSVEKNGNSIENERFEAGTGYNILYLTTDSVTLDTTISCQAGDRLQVHLLAGRFTDFGAFRMTVYNDADTSWVSFTPDLTTHTNDDWIVARNLPDITGLALLKSIAYLLGGTWSVDSYRHQVAFVSFSGIVAKTDQAVDWSSRVDTGTEPSWSPRLDPYAQINYLNWKEVDETKKAPVTVSGLQKGATVNYGDGVINVDAQTLDSDVTLFEMPFGASTDSTQEIATYGNPVLIKTRTVTGSGDSLSITKQSTAPRLLLVSLSDTQPIKTKQLKADGITLEDVIVNLKPSWFGVRPYPAISTETAFTLSFSPVLLSRGEQCIIDRYYSGLLRVLRRMRVINVSMALKPTDIAQLDFERPVRLQRIAIGSSLVLSDTFFYINKISDYIEDRSCQVTLIAF